MCGHGILIKTIINFGITYLSIDHMQNIHAMPFLEAVCEHFQTI